MGKIISTPKSKGQLTKSKYSLDYTSKKQPRGRFVKVNIESIANVNTKPNWWNEHFKK